MYVIILLQLAAYANRIWTVS